MNHRRNLVAPIAGSVTAVLLITVGVSTMRASVLAAASSPSPALTATAVSQTVSIAIVSQCKASQSIEEASVSELDGRNVVDIPLTKVGPFFYTGHATVEPGHYLLGANSRYLSGAAVGSYCWGGTAISVLPGHNRSVGFGVSQLGGPHYDAHGYLYGSLPFAGFSRGTLTNARFDLPVEVDDDAYYIEHAFPGTYVLKLPYGDGLECRISAVVPEDAKGTRLDISIQTAQKCLGFSYHIPSTGERGFVPLFASSSRSSSPLPTATPAAADLSSPAPHYPVETGKWWQPLSRDEKLKAVEGAIDGLTNGWWRGFTEYDTEVEVKFLAHTSLTPKDWISVDNALSKLHNQQKRRVPAFSKKLGYYIDAIDTFYATFPKATAKVTIAEALQCLGDRPWDSCKNVAKLFSR